MARFAQIPNNRFEGVVNHLIKSAPLQKVDDLTRCNCSGLYIMVLDQYKQIYIGVAQNIKDRIKQHWSAKKSFDRLIFGTIESSILSIDSFGALDTTRIYILPMPLQNLLEAEAGFVGSINPIYTLNRVSGGLDSEFAAMFLQRHAIKWDDNIVDFVSIPKKKKTMPIKEKFKKVVEYRTYTKGQNICIDDIAIGDVVCIEYYTKEFKDCVYIGEVKKISNANIILYEYGYGSKVKLTNTKIEKQKNSYNCTLRLAVKCIKNISTTNIEITQQEQSFYKVVSREEINLWE